jgi:magnesium transporter
MSREQTPTTPIIARRVPPGVSINSPGPEFAEFLTPQKLRPKRRRRHLQHDHHGVLAALQAGPSVQGYTTVEGDLYRGAVVDPTAVRMVEDDAITIASTTSTSSSWSLGSNISRGRRATMAVIERFGEAIGVRRGSMSSDSDTSELRSVVTRGTRRRRLSTVLSRTISRGSASTAPERPKRQQLPRRREFTLVLPPTPESDNHPSDRVITTPALPTILEQIKQVRHSRGIAVESPLEVPRRPRSMPGQKRLPVFANPRPQAARAKSRVEMLRGKEEVTRPKSVSDLMGLSNPYGSSTSLSSMREESPPLWKEAKQEEGCWWLDVSCPGWEDLRDIGEVSHTSRLHADNSYSVFTP